MYAFSLYIPRCRSLRGAEAVESPPSVGLRLPHAPALRGRTCSLPACSAVRGTTQRKTVKINKNTRSTDETR